MSFLSYHKRKVAIAKDTNITALRKKAKRYQLWVDNILLAEEINTKDKQKMDYKMDLLDCVKTRLEELQTQKSQQNELLQAAAHYLYSSILHIHFSPTFNIFTSHHSISERSSVILSGIYSLKISIA